MLEDLPRGVDLGLRASKILIAVIAAIVYFVALVEVPGLLRRIGLGGTFIDIVMFVAVPGVFVAAAMAMRQFERWQERRLRAALLPSASLSSASLSSASLSVGGAPTGVPVRVAEDR